MFIQLLMLLVTLLPIFAEEKQCGPECFPKKWKDKEEKEMPLLINISGNLLKDDEFLIDPDFEEVSFSLYTKNTKDEPELFIMNSTDETMFKNFDSKKKTKILTHGWKSSREEIFPRIIKNAYIDLFDYNVILVDWRKISNMFYFTSKRLVPEIGRLVGAFIERLVKAHGAKTSDMHLIGHSLGAHISGIAGKYIANTTLGKLARVTGLDPAKPGFNISQYERLSEESAVFVDVMHTCAPFLGMLSPLGHADFYPNEGIHPQPGCKYDYLGTCSHSRAYHYFVDSILDQNAFYAVNCDDAMEFRSGACDEGVVIMGETLDPKTRGVFYLSTLDARPFGRGLESTKHKG